MSVQRMVEEFHREYGFPIGEDVTKVTETDYEGDDVLESICESMELSSELTEQFVDTDLRIARADLVLEEARELADALMYRDKVAMADALADLAYVVYGTAVAYNIPLDRCIEEVHRSNMTKDKDGNHKPAKGDRWTPPDIKGILGA